MASSFSRPEDELADLLRSIKDELKKLQLEVNDLKRRVTALGG